MADINPEFEPKLRQAFKQFNRVMVLFWRLGLGRMVNIWPSVGGQIMVITHRGRSTGRRRRTPVNYALVDGEIYCTAGFGKVTDWYRNLMADPHVEVWLPNGRWSGVAEDITDRPQALDRLRAVLISSGAAADLFGVHPKTMSDEELRAYTEQYRLIHIRREEALTGPGGPGELAWMWLLVVIFIVTLVVIKRNPAED